jgi:hypothetical protein
MDPKIRNLLENARNLIYEMSVELSRLENEMEEKNAEEPEELLSIRQIVKQYYITQPTLKKYRDQKILKPVNEGHRPFFRRKDISKLMDNLRPNKYPGQNNNS